MIFSSFGKYFNMEQLALFLLFKLFTPSSNLASYFALPFFRKNRHVLKISFEALPKTIPSLRQPRMCVKIDPFFTFYSQ